MRQKNSYSRIIWDLKGWEHRAKGPKIQLFHHCVEKGITSFYIESSDFEVAPKDALGTALSESGLSRDEIQLIGGIKQNDLNFEEIVQKTEELLLNLKTDYLDLLIVDLSANIEVIVPALERLRSQGKIIEVGTFQKDPDQNTTSEEIELRASFLEWKYTPAAVKLLSRDRTPSEDVTEMLFLDVTDAGPEIEPMAEKYQLSKKQFLLAWLLQHPAHYHPVLKGNLIEAIDAAAKAFHTTIIEEDRKKFPEQL